MKDGNQTHRQEINIPKLKLDFVLSGIEGVSILHLAPKKYLQPWEMETGQGVLHWRLLGFNAGTKYCTGVHNSAGNVQIKRLWKLRLKVGKEKARHTSFKHCPHVVFKGSAADAPVIFAKNKHSVCPRCGIQTRTSGPGYAEWCVPCLRAMRADL